MAKVAKAPARAATALRAAIYARKSTEQDEQQSTARQDELGRAFAVSKGWTVVVSYKDEAISGKHDETKRPGLRALLHAVDTKQVDVVVAADDSRLMRDQWNLVGVLKRLHVATVALWYYRETRQVDIATTLGRFLEGVRGYASEAYRDGVRAAVIETLQKKAKAGFVAGGRRPLGYRFVRTGTDVVREIDADEADLVRAIFRHYANGASIRKITKLVPRLRATHSSKAAVRRILVNPLYVGRVVTRWKASGEVVETDQPDLRIITDGLWQQVTRRRAAERKLYLRSDDTGKFWGKPSNGIESRWLLSGMMQCARCGSVLTMIVRNKAMRGYTCLAHERGSAKVGWCSNGLVVPADLAHKTVLTLIESRLDPTIIRDAIVEVHTRLAAAKNPERERAQLERSLATVKKDLANLVAVLKTGRSSVVEEVDRLEAEKVTLETRLADLDRIKDISEIDMSTIDAYLTTHLKDWRDLSLRHVGQSRQLLRKLIPTRLVFEPHVVGKRRWYSFSGDVNLYPLLSGLLPAASDILLRSGNRVFRVRPSTGAGRWPPPLHGTAGRRARR